MLSLKLRVKIKDVVLIPDEDDCASKALAMDIQREQEPDGEIMIVLDPKSKIQYGTGYRGWREASVKWRRLYVERSLLE